MSPETFKRLEALADELLDIIRFEDTLMEVNIDGVLGEVEYKIDVQQGHLICNTYAAEEVLVKGKVI